MLEWWDVASGFVYEFQCLGWCLRANIVSSVQLPSNPPNLHEHLEMVGLPRRPPDGSLPPAMHTRNALDGKVKLPAANTHSIVRLYRAESHFLTPNSYQYWNNRLYRCSSHQSHLQANTSHCLETPQQQQKTRHHIRTLEATRLPRVMTMNCNDQTSYNVRTGYFLMALPVNLTLLALEHANPVTPTVVRETPARATASVSSTTAREAPVNATLPVSGPTS
jgi:hypothetical protein